MQLIFTHVWRDADEDFDGDSVRTLIKKLRKKLPEGLIINVYSGYYKLNIERQTGTESLY